jgi:hypothetical protein
MGVSWETRPAEWDLIQLDAAIIVSTIFSREIELYDTVIFL